MKPVIVTVDPQGRHNEKIEDTFSRILKGGSWKKQRVIVLLPTADTIPAQVALSHWNLIFPPNQAVYRMLCMGMEVGQAYSEAIEQILSHPELSKWEYVLTIEHDNMPPNDGVDSVLESMEAHPESRLHRRAVLDEGRGRRLPQIGGTRRDPVLNFSPQPPAAGERFKSAAGLAWASICGG